MRFLSCNQWFLLSVYAQSMLTRSSASMRTTRSHTVEGTQAFGTPSKHTNQLSRKSTSSNANANSSKRKTTERDENEPLGEVSSDSALSSPPSDLELGDAGEASSYFQQKATNPSDSRKRKRGAEKGHKDGSASSAHVDKIAKTKNHLKDETIDVKPSIKKEVKQKVFKHTPPESWRTLYDTIKAIRVRVPAVIDHLGCERLAEEESARITPKDQRFQTLIALMLSSQTKDTITGATIRKMQQELPGGLTLASILDLEPAKLNILIGSVGFHNRKTEYIKQTAVILRDQFDGDIPETIEDMCSLPGVGPKMAHLLSSSAWHKTMGVGVDTHVHRLSNLFRWVPNTPNPEITRLYLESWLPRDLWHEINWLCVGYGQTFSRKEENIFYKDFLKAYRTQIKSEVKEEKQEDEEDDTKKKTGDGKAIMSMVDEWVGLKKRKAEAIKKEDEADAQPETLDDPKIEEVIKEEQEKEVKIEPTSPEKMFSKKSRRNV